MAAENKMQELIGKTLGGYQIIEQIGKGGMASIFKAYQPSLDREVAIKIMPPYFAQQDESFTTRFKREARAIAKLRHPNILVVMDFGEEGEYAYIVMEYIAAGTLKEQMEQGPMTLRQISTLVGQIAGALDYAHTEGVVHRDIKPSNILMSKKDWALLTDFGLARMVGGSMLTQSGMTVGTPAYMSPEQGSGDPVDHRTDIYSLGVMLYEMVTGEVPYTAETPMAIVVKHIVDPLPMPRAKRPDLPEEVQRIILKALAKKPTDRYQRAGEIAEALNAALADHGDWSAANRPTVVSPAATMAIGATPPPAEGATAVMSRDAAMAAVLGDPIPPVSTRAAQMAAVTPAAPATPAPAKKPNRTPLFVLGGLGILALLVVAALGGRGILRTLRANREAAAQPTEASLGQSPFATADPNQPPQDQPIDVQPGVVPLPPPPELTDHADPMATGNELLAQGDLEGAAAAFYQAMHQLPATYSEVYRIADEAYQNGDPTTAARLLEVALITQVRPNLDHLEYLGNAYEESGQIERAYDIWLFFVQIRPADIWRIYSLIGVAEESGQLERALADLGRLHEQNPNVTIYPLGMGIVQYIQGRYEESVALFESAIRIDPGEWDAYVEIADPLYSLGRIEEADASLNYIAQLGADDADVQDWIAYEFLGWDRYEQAIPLFERSIELDPTSAWTYIGLGDALSESGIDPVRGQEAYLTAHAVASEQSDLWASLSAGWGLYYLGNCDEAINVWNDILAVDPEFVDAIDALTSCAP
ncbi:MAG: tetratricopeptide repeat protein [Anaerolineae bacterium]|nr:MAG: tetratricopeptide repeat protein [Anaerolineae bacterium]